MKPPSIESRFHFGQAEGVLVVALLAILRASTLSFFEGMGVSKEKDEGFPCGRGPPKASLRHRFLGPKAWFKRTSKRLV